MLQKNAILYFIKTMMNTLLRYGFELDTSESWLVINVHLTFFLSFIRFVNATKIKQKNNNKLCIFVWILMTKMTNKWYLILNYMFLRGGIVWIGIFFIKWRFIFFFWTFWWWKITRRPTANETNSSVPMTIWIIHFFYTNQRDEASWRLRKDEKKIK